MAPTRVPHLIGLLATHFAASDHGRVDRLRRLLRSVEEQTHRVPLLASWSADGDADGGGGIAARALDVFKEFESLGVVKPMPRLRGRRSQFQHYARLRETIGRHVKPDKQPVVFFTDDDDIWHPRRAEEYLAAAAERPEAEVLASRMHISPGLAPRLHPSATAADVSQMRALGQLRASLCAEKPDAGLFGAATGEYFDMAVAFHVFDAFFRSHNEAVFANAFADIRFRTFMLKWPGVVHRFMPRSSPDGDSEGVPWMYFYDRTTEPYTTPSTEEDLQYICDLLPDPERIAGLRQTLDCVLFQLAPTQEPFRISALQFAQQLVGLLADQNPATISMALDRCRIHGVEVVMEEEPAEVGVAVG